MTALSDLLNSLNRRDLSTRQIEAEAGERGHKLNFATASRYLRGDHPTKPSAQVLAAFAAVFGTDVNKIREAAGQAPTADRFELPPEADMLNPDERRAVTELVRVMARQKKVGDGDVEATPMNQAGVSPAEEAEKLVARKKRLRAVPDPKLMAAYETGQTEKERLDQEAANRDSGSQDPDDYR